jgi:hypothetical protein
MNVTKSLTAKTHPSSGEFRGRKTEARQPMEQQLSIFGTPEL